MTSPPPTPDANVPQLGDPDAFVRSTSEAGQDRRRGRMWITLGVAALVLAIDQLTKWWAVSTLEGEPPVRVVGDLLKLELVRNPGAAFSLGTGYTFIFTGIAIVVVVVIIRTSRRLGSVWWAIALGGMLGGAIGNLSDRIFRAPGGFQGYVVDFIELPHYPVFNCADMAIVGSAVLMVILALRGIDLDGSRPGD